MMKKMAYYTSWGEYNSKKQLEDFDLSPYTHLIVAFIAPTKSGEIDMIDPWAMRDSPNGGLLGRIHALKKQKYPDLKIGISIGGWNHRSSLSNLGSNKIPFAKNLASFITKHGLDHIDIDWEFENEEIAKKENRLILDLLRTFKKELREATTVSLCIHCNPRTIDAMDVSAIMMMIDWIHLMAYDLSGPWCKTSQQYCDLQSIKKTVDYLVGDAKISLSKIILGVTSWGASFSHCEKMGAGYKDFKLYPIEKLLQLDTRNNTISCETNKTLLEKLGYIDDKGLGGYFVWDLIHWPF